jgi:signal peptidase II
VGVLNGLDTVASRRLLRLPSPGAFARLGITFAIGLLADLWTKKLAVDRLAELAVDYACIPGWLHFTYVENFGAVFGAGQGFRWFFVGVSVIAIGAVVWMFMESGRRRLYQILLGMLLAGIIGNLYDRMVYGYVRDMIHALPQWPRLFPWVFNVADSLLCVSIGALMVYGLMFPDRPRGGSDADGR